MTRAPSFPMPAIDYERIKPPRRGRAYPYKCRSCGAPAMWKETLVSRDRRRFRMPWCVCDRCHEVSRDT